jgi:hypothetical protein
MEKQRELINLIRSAAQGPIESGEERDGKARTGLDITMEVINLVVPELTVEYMRDKMTNKEIREVNKLVQLYLNDTGDETEEEKELSYYRGKYGDEYRKNKSATEENA